MEGRYDGNPFEEDVNPLSVPRNVSTASSSQFWPLPPEPAETSATVIPLDSLKDLKKREEQLQAREAELNMREKELKRREEAAAKAGIVIEEKNYPVPAEVQNILHKYGNMWVKEFASVRSQFENSVTHIHTRITSALKAELISLFDCNEAEKGNPSSLTEKCAVEVLTRELPVVRKKKEQARWTENTSDVAIIYDERMLAHKPPKGELWHEIPERLSKIKDRLTQDGIWQRCQIFKCDEAKTESLEAVHDAAHVSDVKMISSEGKEPVDEDMYYSIGTTEAALLAAGGVIKAADLVAKGKVQASFAIVRPPGHHVGINGPPRGFCFLNNISVATAHLLKEHGMKRILLLDWDIHHGDGTQQIFYNDERVLFFSVHRGDAEAYPCSKERELDYLGEGSGLGYNVNICWPHQKIRDVDYHVIWDHILVPMCQEFKPEIILISAGFDAAKGDKLGKCEVTPNGFATLLRKLKPLAPIAMALEGGYNTTAIAQSTSACIKELLGDKSETVRSRSVPYETTLTLASETKQKLKPYWKCMDSGIPEDLWHRTIAPSRSKSTKPIKSAASSVPG